MAKASGAASGKTAGLVGQRLRKAKWQGGVGVGDSPRTEGGGARQADPRQDGGSPGEAEQKLVGGQGEMAFCGLGRAVGGEAPSNLEHVRAQLEVLQGQMAMNPQAVGLVRDRAQALVALEARLLREMYEPAGQPAPAVGEAIKEAAERYDPQAPLELNENGRAWARGELDCDLRPVDVARPGRSVWLDKPVTLGGAEPEPAGEVGQQLAQLRTYALELSHSVQAAAERLGPVLGLLPAEPSTGRAVPPEPGCKLAAEVQTVWMSLRDTLDNLEGLMHRVQL